VSNERRRKLSISEGPKLFKKEKNRVLSQILCPPPVLLSKFLLQLFKLEAWNLMEKGRL